MTVPYKKKLIEVALPLEAINAGCQQEKNPFLKGHPRSLHLWWARRPLAACRAVLFASLVDDPSAHPEKFPTEEAQEAERQRLFRIIEDLVKWENSNNERVLKLAREEILKSTNGKPPPVYDPFCGGGSIPLEAQRLGLEAHASDLNPVPVLITKALIEIPPNFAGKPPVNPEARKKLSASGSWKGAAGLAEDVRYYGKWMRDEAENRIGHLYPKVKLPKEQGGGEATVIAWLWARTVASPNPAARGTHVPLVRSFWLSTKAGKKTWVEPVVDQKAMTYRFGVRTGTPVHEALVKAGTKTARGANFRCLLTQAPISNDYVRSEARAGKLGTRLIAVAYQSARGCSYIAPPAGQEEIANSAKPSWKPDQLVTTPCHDVDRLPMYGMPMWGDVFTSRQLTALSAYCELIEEVRKQVRDHAIAAGNSEQSAESHAKAVAIYLAFSVNHLARYSCTLCSWNSTNQNVAQAFGRQALQMVWDFAECNPVAGVLDIASTSEWVVNALMEVPTGHRGTAEQQDARSLNHAPSGVICTDPPYFDNIGYAELSDFFYVWLRRSLRPFYSDLFQTVLVPKSQELIAAAHRFRGDKEKAREFFESGLLQVFERMRTFGDPTFPATVFYAFKQTEQDDDEDGESDLAETRASTGWETMLEGLVRATWQIDGTWPLHTERIKGLKGSVNALASSIVLVCRPRPNNAGMVSRRDFLAELKKELPEALRHLQKGNIAPVDLAQAAIGPGMAVFSRYARVLETDGSTMSVRTALSLINQSLDEVLAEQEGEFDADTRWALAWFDQYGFTEGPYGAAETLSTAKNTSVNGMSQGGILVAKAGKVRLLKKEELPADWDPSTDERQTIWEITHHLIRRLEQGESGAADLIRQLGAKAEVARDLSYRLYTICERRKWATDAIAYNTLVLSWTDVQRLAAEKKPATPAQGELI